MIDEIDQTFVKRMLKPFVQMLGGGTLAGILARVAYSFGSPTLQATIVAALTNKVSSVNPNLLGIVALFLVSLGTLCAGRATVPISKIRWRICYAASHYLLCGIAAPIGATLGFCLFSHATHQEKLLLALSIYAAFVFCGLYLFIVWTSFKGRITTREPLMKWLAGASCVICLVSFYVSVFH